MEDKQLAKLEEPIQVSSNQGPIGFGIAFIICIGVFILKIVDGSTVLEICPFVLALVLGGLYFLFVPILVIADADGLKTTYLTGQKKLIPWEDIHTLRTRRSPSTKICRVMYGSPEKTVSFAIEGPFEFAKADSRLEIVASQADLQFVGKTDRGGLLYRRRPNFS